MTRLAATLAVAAFLVTLAPSPDLGASSPARSVGAAVRAATPSHTPFRGLTTTTMHVGGKALHVVIAKTGSQRQRGLRQRSALGSYDAMLFVFPANTDVGFTMSTVPVSLDIGFYRSDGRTVDTLRMVPCSGTEASCPIYRARHSFRYTLETLAGALPAGTLSG